jgi:glycosyltransferase involved in cell wall biosynthesis
MASVGKVDPLRVIMFPGVGIKDGNRYLDILVDGLRSKGVEVEGWNKQFSTQTGDVFHVHWPELVADIAHRKWQYLRGWWIARQFFGTIKRIKKRGGKLVWTCHNLVPHSQLVKGSAFHRKLMARFIPAVDVAISMTEDCIGDIKRNYPGIDRARFVVARHPHYRSVLGSGEYDQESRRRIGIAPEQKVISLIGVLRPNKRPDLLAQAFLGLPGERYFLLLAGAASAELGGKLKQMLGSASNVHLALRHLSESEVLTFNAMSDALIFPGENYFNSGTIYTALSLNVPVIAVESTATLELQRLVGKEWLQLYSGDLSTEKLQAAVSRLVSRKGGVACDLSEFSPERVAEQHLVAYSSVTSSHV